jgi:hypothetical protein
MTHNIATRIPLELQLVLLQYLTYRTVVALRLTSRHFAHGVVPLSTLLRLRKEIIGAELRLERVRLQALLRTHSLEEKTWRRYFHQLPTNLETYYSSPLLSASDRSSGGDDVPRASYGSVHASMAQLEAVGAMNVILCYTCLEHKSITSGQFVRAMYTGSRGVGQRGARKRVCKECMLQNGEGSSHGRWWFEGRYKPKDSNMEPPLAASMVGRFLHLLTGHGDEPKLANRRRECGICAKCRREQEPLYWGCARCFDGFCEQIQREDLSDQSALGKLVYKTQVKYSAGVAWWNRYAVEDRPLRRKDFINPTTILQFIKNVLEGCDTVRYKEWKRRRGLYDDPQTSCNVPGGTGEVDSGIHKASSRLCKDTKTNHGEAIAPKGKYWESRCQSCWCRVRPQSRLRPRNSHGRCIDATLIALPDTARCPNCQKDNLKSS